MRLFLSSNKLLSNFKSLRMSINLSMSIIQMLSCNPSSKSSRRSFKIKLRIVITRLIPLKVLFVDSKKRRTL